MKNYFTILMILIIITSLKLRSTGNYKYALNEDRSLFVEVYRSGLTGNMTSEYLTDSANFRICLGTYNRKQASIQYKLNGDQIIIEKRMHSVSPLTDTLKTVEKQTYSLKELITRRNFN